MHKNRLYVNMTTCIFHTQLVDFPGIHGIPRRAVNGSCENQSCPGMACSQNCQGSSILPQFCKFLLTLYFTILSNREAAYKPHWKDVPFLMTDKCIAAFKKLKEVFTTAPILVHFQHEFQTTVETDAF